MESYSKPLIRFILINYLDLSCGLSPRIFDEMKAFTKSKGTGNPQQTLTIWKSDIDAGISSLAPKHDIWGLISLGITPSLLLIAANHRELSNLQRRIISGCMLDPCAGCQGKFKPNYCENDWTIGRMKNYLNGKRPGNAEHKT